MPAISWNHVIPPVINWCVWKQLQILLRAALNLIHISTRRSAWWHPVPVHAFNYERLGSPTRPSSVCSVKFTIFHFGVTPL